MPRRADDYLFRIEELVLRYDLEPKLRDLFVEGAADASVISWWALKKGLPLLKAFAIESVYVPAEQVPEPFRSGNRGRVIALAIALSARLATARMNAYCLIDRDLETVVRELPDIERLWLTDFSCLESYTFEFDVVRNVFHLFMNASFSQAEFDRLIAILQKLFLIRITKYFVAREVTWVTPISSLKIRNGQLEFDSEAFLLKLLTYQGYPELAAPFRERMSLIDLSGLDYRAKFHKDDLREIACWMAREKHVPQHLRREEVVDRMLLAQFSSIDLTPFPLFVRLEEWANT